MPGTTPLRGYPYPLDTDLIDVAGDIKRLADALDADIAPIYPTGWSPVTVGNGFMVWGAPFYTVASRLRSPNVGELRGLIRITGHVLPGNVYGICWINAAHVPAAQTARTALVGWNTTMGSGRLDVNPDGAVAINSNLDAADGGFIALDGVTWTLS